MVSDKCSRLQENFLRGKKGTCSGREAIAHRGGGGGGGGGGPLWMKIICVSLGAVHKLRHAEEEGGGGVSPV